MELCSACGSTKMSFVCFESFRISDVVGRVLGGERAITEDAVFDIALVRTVFNGEFVFLGIVLAVMSVEGDVIRDCNEEEVFKGDIGPGDDVRNSPNDT